MWLQQDVLSEGRRGTVERILLVDDEESILTVLQFHLEKAGYITETATHPKEVFQRVQQGEPG